MSKRVMNAVGNIPMPPKEGINRLARVIAFFWAHSSAMGVFKRSNILSGLPKLLPPVLPWKMMPGSHLPTGKTRWFSARQKGIDLSDYRLQSTHSAKNAPQERDLCEIRHES